MSLRIIGFVGSLNRPTKTRTLVDLVTARATAALGATVATYDLTDLQPGIDMAMSLDDLDGQQRSIASTLLSADLLMVGNPVYKGWYTGLFQHFST
jgi:FMN reductase